MNVLGFFAEMATYVCVAIAAGRIHLVWGMASVLLMARWWGSLHSPKAPRRLPVLPDRVLRALWFGIGLVAVVVVVRRH